jgi:hypothetical protein
MGKGNYRSYIYHPLSRFYLTPPGGTTTVTISNTGGTAQRDEKLPRKELPAPRGTGRGGF